MTVVDFKGGRFDGLRVEISEDVPNDVAANSVRSAMFFHVKEDPPEIKEARETLKTIFAQGE